MVDWGGGCLYGAMRLFRVHIQAVQASLLLTLPVYIPCTPRAIDVDAKVRIFTRFFWRVVGKR